MGDIQFNGTQEEWDALLKKNKSKYMTVVEWLEKEIWKRGAIGENTPTWLQELYEQAKQMERLEHSRTWDKALDTYEERGSVYVRAWEDFDEYYAETYGSKGSGVLTEGSGAVTSSQTEISDEEIKKAAHEHGYEHHSFFTAATSNQKKLSWIAACKWYREQLKKK